MLHVAPMAKTTNRFMLRLLRQITKRTRLWTEMVVAETVIRNPSLVRSRFFPADEDSNVVLQLASGDVERLTQAADKALDEYAFSEVNLNAGCPAHSATCGDYGAFLLKDPARLCHLAESLKKRVGPRGVDVSVKLRTGIAGDSSVEKLVAMVKQLELAGVDHVVLHARDAMLNESPRSNRKVPPIREDWAVQLAQSVSPRTRLTYNGEVKDHARVHQLLNHFDGVMVGRQVIADPFGMLATADETFYGEPKRALVRRDVVLSYAQWLDEQSALGLPTGLYALSPLLNVYLGHPGSRQWKERLLTSTEATPQLSYVERIRAAADLVDESLHD